MSLGLLARDSVLNFADLLQQEEANEEVGTSHTGFDRGRIENNVDSETNHLTDTAPPLESILVGDMQEISFHGSGDDSDDEVGVGDEEDDDDAENLSLEGVQSYASEGMGTLDSAASPPRQLYESYGPVTHSGKKRNHFTLCKTPLLDIYAAKSKRKQKQMVESLIDKLPWNKDHQDESIDPAQEDNQGEKEQTCLVGSVGGDSVGPDEQHDETLECSHGSVPRHPRQYNSSNSTNEREQVMLGSEPFCLSETQIASPTPKQSGILKKSSKAGLTSRTLQARAENCSGDGTTSVFSTSSFGSSSTCSSSASSVSSCSFTMDSVSDERGDSVLACSDTRPLHPTKHVRFSEDVPPVFLAPSGTVGDSVCDAADVWWQAADYAEFRKVGELISKAIQDGDSQLLGEVADDYGNYDANEEPDTWWRAFGHSSRGLEHIVSMEEGTKRRLQAKKAIDAVLCEQREQKQKNISVIKADASSGGSPSVLDSNRIRAVSLAETQWAKDIARNRGYEDALQAASLEDDGLMNSWEYQQWKRYRAQRKMLRMQRKEQKQLQQKHISCSVLARAPSERSLTFLVRGKTQPLRRYVGAMRLERGLARSRRLHAAACCIQRSLKRFRDLRNVSLSAQGEQGVLAPSSSICEQMSNTVDLQALVRMYLVRCRYLATRRAVKRIQGWYKQRLSRLADSLKPNAVVLQALVRMYTARRRFQATRNAVLRIQYWTKLRVLPTSPPKMASGYDMPLTPQRLRTSSSFDSEDGDSSTGSPPLAHKNISWTSSCSSRMMSTPAFSGEHENRSMIISQPYIEVIRGNAERWPPRQLRFVGIVILVAVAIVGALALVAESKADMFFTAWNDRYMVKFFPPREVERTAVETAVSYPVQAEDRIKVLVPEHRSSDSESVEAEMRIEGTTVPENVDDDNDDFTVIPLPLAPELKEIAQEWGCDDEDDVEVVKRMKNIGHHRYHTMRWRRLHRRLMNGWLFKGDEAIVSRKSLYPHDPKRID